MKCLEILLKLCTKQIKSRTPTNGIQMETLPNSINIKVSSVTLLIIATFTSKWC